LRDNPRNLALASGARLGVYEVTSQIGVGGMGEVYRATDTRLKRQVALKILPASLATDPDRLARFEREAEVLASLNHPNIAAIHGLEESDGVKALVMELVEGATLADRIAQGAIPVDEALPIAKQIAEALEAAHEQGVIHRDLKPANIKVRPDGTVKVLDFGLAKALQPAGVGAATSLSMSPTIASPAVTAAGIILGTAAYMSPEQARGVDVDRRADLWAFGVVLYEMLTGRQLFDSATVSDTVAYVLMKEPDWSALPANTPPLVRGLLRRCLEKDRKRRLDSASVVRLEVEEASTAAPVFKGAAAPTVAEDRRGRLVWMAACAVAVVGASALAVPAVRHLRETPRAVPAETRTDLVTPPTDQPSNFALSPDGQKIVFVASGDGGSRLWLRSLSTTTAHPLAGTEGARYPFWSPDSRSVGFFAAGAMKRLDVDDGAASGMPQSLAPAINGVGGTWNADGVIVYAPSAVSPLMRVPASGGNTAAVTTLGPHQLGHRAPYFLPDGRTFLFYSDAGIYLGTLNGGAPTLLTRANSRGVFLPDGTGRDGVGWLMWERFDTRTVVVQRLNVARATLTGDPVTMAVDVMADLGWTAVSVATTGLVAYRAGGGKRELEWFNRSGASEGVLGDPNDNNQLGPRLSPDGRRVVVARGLANEDLWLLDGRRTSRLTFDPAADGYPLWSPDGTRIVFRSTRTNVSDLYVKAANGAGDEERIVASDEATIPTSWSSDGRFVLYHSFDPQSNGDLWVVPMQGAHTPSVFLRTPFREAYGAFSPDGRWVAYHSNETGRPEIYIRPFVPPDAAGKTVQAGAAQWQVSTAGGIHAVWRRDGRELYYVDPAGTIMAASITVNGATIEPGTPVALFPTHIAGSGADTQLGQQYDVAADGRFLINTELDSGATPITLIQNWNPDIRK
jgi:eukaryotic-like serine/threonine-protein kinase